MRRFAFFLALSLSPQLVNAQSHPLVGEWDLSYSGGFRIENGERVPLTMKGTLSVKLQGDSLVAILTPIPQEGVPPRPPARLAAKRVDGTVTFVYKSEAVVNLGGTESKRTAISTYAMQAAADAITGTVQRTIEGLDFPATPEPVTGTRRKT
jgi:hypothetical protein